MINFKINKYENYDFPLSYLRPISNGPQHRGHERPSRLRSCSNQDFSGNPSGSAGFAPSGSGPASHHVTSTCLWPRTSWFRSCWTGNTFLQTSSDRGSWPGWRDSGTSGHWPDTLPMYHKTWSFTWNCSQLRNLNYSSIHVCNYVYVIVIE